MKAKYIIFVLMAIGGTVLFGPVMHCIAAENEGEDIWSLDKNRRTSRGSELTKERIEHLMGQLREKNPEKTEELTKLQKENPEQFRSELRILFGQDRSARTKGSSRRSKVGRGRGRTRSRSDDREEFLEWLEKNYPEELEKLRLFEKGDSPEVYKRRIYSKRSQYGRIFLASKRNPELAEVLKDDLALKKQRDRLVKQIRATDDESRKKELTSELEEVVGQRFDVLVKRKRIEYEELLRKLEALKERIKKSKAVVDKWKDTDFKGKSVNTRIEKLINTPEEFKWE